MNRRPVILGIMYVLGVCAGAERAEGQGQTRSRWTRRPMRAVTSPLLDRMFARNCWPSPRWQKGPAFVSRSLGTTYYSDGTPFDPFSVGSFPDRFQNSAALYGTTAVSAALRDGSYMSSNAVNMQAPASYGLTPPSSEAWSGALTPRQIGGWSAGAEPVMASAYSSPAQTMPPPNGEFAQAMWSARQARLAEPIEAPRPTGPADVAMQIGDKSFRRGEYALARDDYRRALARDENDPHVRLALGLAEFARGRWPQASRAIAEGLKKGPDIDPESFDLRKAYGRSGDFEKHRARLEAVAAKSPEDAGLCLLLGYVRYFSGDAAGGRAAWEKYAAMPGADPATMSNLDSIVR